jgi:hypothetical protein
MPKKKRELLWPSQKFLRPGKPPKPKKWPLVPVDLPFSIDNAKKQISEVTLALDRTIHEHAYKFGMLFCWVKRTMKAEGRRDFVQWVPANTRYSYRTARRFMMHAEKCAEYGAIFEYEPSKGKGKFDIVSQMDATSETNLEDSDNLETTEVETPAADKKLEKMEEGSDWVWDPEKAADGVYYAFLRSIWDKPISDKRKVEKLVTKQIKKYVDGEARTEFLFKKMGLNGSDAFHYLNLSHLQLLKDEAIKKASFDQILKEARKIMEEASEQDSED